MPRVSADLTLLVRHAELLEHLDGDRRRRTDHLEHALEAFFTSGSDFGPRSSDIAVRLRRLWDDTAVDAVGVLATIAAFRDADVARSVDPTGSWQPDDAWLERARRAWLRGHHPHALEAAVGTLDAAALLARVAQIDRLLGHDGPGAGLSPAVVSELLAERSALLGEALVVIDDLTDAIGAWSTPRDHRVLDGLVAERADLIELVVAGNPWAADRLHALVAAGVGAAMAFAVTMREAAHEDRVREVMDVEGLDRAAAEARIEVMDAAIAGLVAAGHPIGDAVVAFAMADHLDLDLMAAVGIAAGHDIGIIDALGRMAMAASLDLDDDGLVALMGLRGHFDVFDDARSGSRDGRVSVADLVHVLEHPGDYLPGQVEAARAILDEPVLRHRLDTAASDTDVLDTDVFGGRRPGDGVISRDDIDAFLVRARLNHVLGPHAGELDVAADGGAADGFFSHRDLEAWLEANPTAPVEVRDGVQYMLDAGLVDRSWLEQNRDALAMGAAVVAGGVVIVASGGTATPLVLAIGFGAGAGAAGMTTIGVNAMTGDDLGDGVLTNALSGGFIGLSMAGLPDAWRGAAAIRSGVTVESLGSTAGLVGEVGSIVDHGGIDLVLPDDWEEEVHDVAGIVDTYGGLLSAGLAGLDGLPSTGSPDPAP